ncbi:uncharacterized protein LOC123265513 [Cotesia glomerata]|uniref:uncharacterized protein LOC123265513 n=1 Tax=Cotesia glomerata TaxID=32391 RepID=UPI001D025C50|nr:uncharacterized protein LOC123265513 [Cotesia glomerata]
MFTLDKIANQLAYQEKSNCVFEQLGKCSINREMGIVCREHARQVFGIGLMNAVLALPTGETRLHGLVATEARTTFLPFPYEFQWKGGALNKDEKPCRFNQEEMITVIKDYVRQSEIYSPELAFRVESALLSLISDGAMYNKALPQASYNYHVFCNQNIRSYLLKRWKNCWIAVKHFEKGANNKINKNVIKFDEYPVNKLPVFYQIMLMYLPMSYNTVDTNTNPDATITSELLTPRVILNADQHRFEYCNNQDPSKLYLLRGNATSATPLVLAGRQEHKYSIELFKQSSYYTYSLLDQFDTCPPGNV